MSLRRDILLKNMGSGLPPRHLGPSSLGNRLGGGRRGPRDFTPLPWTDYFDRCESVTIPEISSTFCVYTSGFQNDEDTPPAPLIILLHGGGYSGLTWATFVKHLRELVHVKVAAIDIRGHGNTTTNDDSDLSIETLTRDVGLLVQKLVTDEETRVILMGHSMGGAIAVRASALCNELAQSLAGLVVIDVVEGTALEALQGMQSFLRGRPKEFSNLENAIEWCVRSGQTKNIESARVSMPSQLTPLSGGPSESCSNVAGIPDIPEDSEDLSRVQNEQPTALPSNIKYKFRVDLPKSEVYWRGWFEGLSEQFLSSKSPAKLLLLAGVDRLDRTLTVGQMQGKFQMQVLPQCGHAVHEDVPDKVCLLGAASAEVIFIFALRVTLQ